MNTRQTVARALVATLTDPRPSGTIAELTALATPTPFAGVLVLGNLTMFAHLIGTPWQLDPTDAVLLIEEVGEAPYMIDRDLTQLGLAGLLAGARGVIVGDLTRCTDPPHRVIDIRAAGVIEGPWRSGGMEGGIPLQGRERRPEFMRRIGDEPAHLGMGGGRGVEHGVEGAAELGGFRAGRTGGDSSCPVAGRDGLRGLRHRRNGPQP